MKILTFDTSLDKTYITLSDKDLLLESKTIKSTDEKYHSAFLMPAIVDILKSQNIFMEDIDVIGTNIGPGSFTGIRVCTTIARVFAQQLNAKLIGVSSLQILSKINETDKNSIILMDARKNKVYCGIYSPQGQTVKEPKSIEKESLLELLQDEYFIITDSSISNFLKENKIESVNYEAKSYELGNFLAQLTYQSVKASEEDFHWAKVKPLYIQPPSISKPKAV